MELRKLDWLGLNKPIKIELFKKSIENYQAIIKLNYSHTQTL